MKKCAFCLRPAKLSNEHIASRWMDELFPGENIHHRESRGERTEWTTHDEIDWKARVVCEPCNNGWMSEIESKRAKPVLTPLITGDTTPNEITQKTASSMAVWVYKTAVVLDHAHHRSHPWFPEYVREAFRIERKMPSSVSMWICGILDGRRSANILTMYARSHLSPTYPIHSYVCSGSIGNFAFQFISVKQKRNVEIFPDPEFDQIAVPIWPAVYPGLKWHFPVNLNGEAHFLRFADRWRTISHGPPPND
jgi:hypothetical protein